MPGLSAVIIAFNEEKYIAETIFSAINQSYKNLKILVSDNCSTDNTYEILKTIKVEHSNIIAIKQEKNIGAAENFNFLVETANTDFFCWLSGHDILQKDYISSAVNAFKDNPDLSLVYPKSVQIDEKGILTNIPPSPLISPENPQLIAKFDSSRKAVPRLRVKPLPLNLESF